MAFLADGPEMTMDGAGERPIAPATPTLEPSRDDLASVIGELRRENAELRAQVRVLEAAPIILFILDARGTVLVSEGRGLEHIGFEPGEIVGRSVFDVLGDEPESLARVRRALAG